MQLFKIRKGFATNSSSTHSILIFPDSIHEFTDEYEIDDYEIQFGWDNFTVASKVAKAVYLAATLISNEGLLADIPQEYAVLLAVEMVTGSDWDPTDIQAVKAKLGADKDIWVDHQSLMTLPVSGKLANSQFLQELKTYLYNDNIVIIGGNDNDNECVKKFYPPHQKVLFPFLNVEGPLVARKDNNYWTLFNQNTGCKIRFSFESLKQCAPKRAETPELVDVKITDHCDKGCSFCYQNSEPNQKHADLSNLTYALSELEIFEVALGGGEPTSHPDFVHIVKKFRQNGIVPNFSTKSLDWLRDPKQWVPIIQNIGAFAYSATSVAEIDDLVALLNINGIDKSKASIQYILGGQPLYQFQNILTTCNKYNLRLTLLGFKKVGKGCNFKCHDIDDWVKILKKTKSYDKVGIDTMLAAKYHKELVKAGVSELSFETKEGTFSMYIDAVTGKVGPSSFCNKSDMVTIAKWSAHDIKEAFQNFKC